MTDKLSDIDKVTLKRRISSNEVTFISPPKSMIRSQEIDIKIKAVLFGSPENDKLAPFLCCDNCKSLFLWFKKINDRWVNQSGMSAIKSHIANNCSKSSITSFTIKRSFECVGTSKPALPKSSKEQWQKHLVKLVCEHPTVSLNSMAKIASSCGDFASTVTHRNNRIFDFQIGRTYIASGLTTEGEISHSKLENFFSSSVNDPLTGVSCMIDYWSGKHQHRLSYCAIVICGVDKDWRWFRYPLKICDLDDVSHDAEFTFKFLEDCLKTEEAAGLDAQKFCNPLFVVSDNEPKMVAAFDGRYPTTLNFGGRVGCTEHALSTCVKYVFEKSPPSSLENILSNLTTIESFYNTRDQNARSLKRAIPDKCTTRPWRFHHLRLQSAIENYTVFLSEEDYHVADTLPPLSSLKALLDIMEIVKRFFDRVEINGPTSHLSYMNYLTMDVSLFRIEINKELPAVSSETARLLREKIRTNLWPYCGSAFSKAACYLSGIDVCSMTASMVNSLPKGSATRKEVSQFTDEWKQDIDTFKTDVMNYIYQLLDSMHFTADIASDEASLQESETAVTDLFDTIYAPPCKRSKATNSFRIKLDEEIVVFESMRRPSKNPGVEFWKKNPQLEMLSRCAKVLLATPVSSAAIERLFSETGLILSKLRKKLKSQKLSAMIYNKYVAKLEADGFL